MSSTLEVIDDALDDTVTLSFEWDGNATTPAGLANGERGLFLLNITTDGGDSAGIYLTADDVRRIAFYVANGEPA